MLERDEHVVPENLLLLVVLTVQKYAIWFPITELVFEILVGESSTPFSVRNWLWTVASRSQSLPLLNKLFCGLLIVHLSLPHFP